MTIRVGDVVGGATVFRPDGRPVALAEVAPGLAVLVFLRHLH